MTKDELLAVRDAAKEQGVIILTAEEYEVSTKKVANEVTRTIATGIEKDLEALGHKKADPSEGYAQYVKRIAAQAKELEAKVHEASKTGSEELQKQLQVVREELAKRETEYDQKIKGFHARIFEEKIDSKFDSVRTKVLPFMASLPVADPMRVFDATYQSLKSEILNKYDIVQDNGILAMVEKGKAYEAFNYIRNAITAEVITPDKMLETMLIESKIISNPAAKSAPATPNGKGNANDNEVLLAVNAAQDFATKAKIMEEFGIKTGSPKFIEIMNKASSKK